MKVTLNIDSSNSQALALLNYLNTLDFVSTEENLSERQKEAINIGLQDIQKNKTTSYNDVIKETKKKYPQLFR